LAPPDNGKLAGLIDPLKTMLLIVVGGVAQLVTSALPQRSKSKTAGAHGRISSRLLCHWTTYGEGRDGEPPPWF